MTVLTADWLSVPATRKVCDALSEGGAQVFFVGGCVRNSLLGAKVSDIDIATDLLPDVVTKRANAANIKVIPTGVDHGTVTLVQDGLAHEVTTFRSDISTDGRRAVVAFSNNIQEDAQRRDFTMNALYARPDGTVVDPLDGLPDLMARRVKFIGNAEDRIHEDYLRSLRFFRFHAWYGDLSEGFDEDSLAAIASNLDGLHLLSRERVGIEMLKLLSAPDPATSLAAMRSTGMLLNVLSGADDTAIAPLVHLELETNTNPNPIRRLATIGGEKVSDRLRLRKAQSSCLTKLYDASRGTSSPEELGYRLGVQCAIDALLVRCSLTGQPWDETYRSRVKLGESSKFPVQARDLMPSYTGPALGKELNKLEAAWIESGFTLDRTALLRLSDLQ